MKATLSNTSGDLGLITEKIPLGDQVFGRTDLTYLAYRAGVPLIEILIPPRGDHSRIDWAPNSEIYIDISYLAGRIGESGLQI